MGSKAPVKRGCGVREPGGVYIETLMSPTGKPLEYFLIDPPRALPDGLDIPDRGVLIQARPDGSGTHDVFKFVGESFYPNVADFIEEVRQHGLSQHVSANIDFSKIGVGSLIFLAHHRAIIENAHILYEALYEEGRQYPGAAGFSCPCGRPDHATLTAYETTPEPGQPTCAGLWYETVNGGAVDLDPTRPPRTVNRTVGSTTYAARHGFEGIAPVYQDGLFLRLPIHRLAVIADPEGGRDVRAIERVKQSDLPWIVEDF